MFECPHSLNSSYTCDVEYRGADSDPKWKIKNIIFSDDRSALLQNIPVYQGTDKQNTHV